jgi:hypothetical protein
LLWNCYCSHGYVTVKPFAARLDAYLGGRSGVRRPGVDPASSVGEPLAGVAAAAVGAAAAASPARSCVVVAAAAASSASCAAACAAAVRVLLRGHVRRGRQKVAFY